MANLTIKNFPPSVRDVRRHVARAEDGVAERARRRRMRETREEFERFLATLPRMSDSIDLIREDRDRLGLWPRDSVLPLADAHGSESFPSRDR